MCGQKARPRQPLLVRVPADFVPKLGRLRAYAARVEEAVDRLMWDLRWLDASGPDSAEWIRTFNIDWAGGGCEVEVNGMKRRLAPHLGRLLEALADRRGISSDRYVPYKTLDQLRSYIVERNGEAVSNATLNKYINKIRQFLGQMGLPAAVIHVSRGRGRRLEIAADWASDR